MSILSTRHTIVPFIAGESKAFMDQRLAKVGYKTSKHKSVAKKSVCVSIPKIMQPFSSEELEALNPHILEMLENVQDKIIKNLYEAGATEISENKISIESCISFMEEEDIGGRLTIEKIEQWFQTSLMNTLKEFLTLQGAKKLTGESLEKAVHQSLVGYKTMLSALSGGNTHYDVQQREKLVTVLSLAQDEEDGFSERLMKRLEVMEQKDKKVCADLGLIDFS